MQDSQKDREFKRFPVERDEEPFTQCNLFVVIGDKITYFLWYVQNKDNIQFSYLFGSRKILNSKHGNDHTQKQHRRFHIGYISDGLAKRLWYIP